MSQRDRYSADLPDQARTYFPHEAFEFSDPAGAAPRYLTLKTGWGLKTSHLTLTGAGSPSYSPVTGEAAIGEFHPLGRATPSAEDAITTTATTTSPATLSLSSLVPVGTTWVEVSLEISQSTASEVQHNNGSIWDYDFGAHDRDNTFTKGLSVTRASRPAMATAEYVLARAFGKVKIGASRKLYYGMSSAAMGDTMYIYIRGYYI